MKLLRYRTPEGIRLGVLDGNDVVDLVEALEADGSFTSSERASVIDTVPFIAAGAAGRALALRALEASRGSGRGRRKLAELRLAAPLRPEAILCSGENYYDHREEKPPVEGKEPEFFIKLPQCVVGPGDEIILDPKVTKKLDYETELAIVIGKAGRHISAESALEHVFGYTIMHDCTARDRQVKLRPDGTAAYAIGGSKNFDTCAPMGPVIVTSDEIPDPQTLALRTTVNGELRQNNTTAHMIWGVAELVVFFSTYVTLQPGFVISTGTPGGTAWGSDPELGGRPRLREDVVLAPGYLQPGDVVTCEIEGIGVLSNPIVLAGSGPTPLRSPG